MTTDRVGSLLAVLTGTDGPFVHAQSLSKSDLQRLETHLRIRNFEIRRVDMSIVTTDRDFVDAVATAWSFPGWFGGTWDGLAELLMDLRWIPAAGYVTIMCAVRGDESRPALLGMISRVFADVGQELASPVAGMSIHTLPLPFHLVRVLR